MLYWQRLLIIVYGTDSGEKREGLKADADMAQTEDRAYQRPCDRIVEVRKHVSVIKSTLVKYYLYLRSGFKTIFFFFFFQKDANNFFVLLSPSLAICAEN